GQEVCQVRRRCREDCCLPSSHSESTGLTPKVSGKCRRAQCWASADRKTAGICPLDRRVRRPRRALLHASRLFRDGRQLVQADPCCSRRAQAPAKTILPRSNGIMNESSTIAKSARLNGNSNTAKAKPASELTNTPRVTVATPMNMRQRKRRPVVLAFECTTHSSSTQRVLLHRQRPHHLARR